MKKVLRFARSMRFGLILLLPVLVCSVLGSVIPQGESESYYTAHFPQAYHLILGLGLNRMFATPGFLILSGLATGASWLCYYKALQVGEASKVVPVDKLSVIITLVLAFLFLHERFTAKSLIGCALIGAGTLLMVL